MLASSSPGPVVLVLASGRGERFQASGGATHKLYAPLGSTTVLEHTLAAVRASGLAWHVEDAGHAGMGDSIAAAVRATAGANGWLVLPADLPLVLPGTLRNMACALQAAAAEGGAVVQPVYQGERGHPVGFASACGAELMALTGEQGAARIVRQYAQQGRLRQVSVEDVGTVTDVDTIGDLGRAERILALRGADGAGD